MAAKNIILCRLEINLCWLWHVPALSQRLATCKREGHHVRKTSLLLLDSEQSLSAGAFLLVSLLLCVVFVFGIAG